MGDCCFPCCGGSVEEDEYVLDLSQGTEIPVKNRKQTDVSFLIILGILSLFLVVSVSVASGLGDIKRLIHPYDDKGNICGYINKPIEGIEGSGMDFREKKFLLTKQNCKFYNCKTEKVCVSECENGYDSWIIPSCKFDGDDNLKAYKSFLKTMMSDISLCGKEIIALCFVSIFLSGLMLTVLRMYAKTVIKTILIIAGIAAIVLPIFTWIMYSQNASSIEKYTYDQKRKSLVNQMMNWLIAASIATTFSVLFFAMLYFVRHKLTLIHLLFEEGGKCIKDIPIMLLQPIFTHLITALFACLVGVGFAFLLTSGKGKLDSEGKIMFPISIFFQITTWLLLFGFLWVSQFFLACQNFVIAGAVSSWYFSRVKGKLDSPVWRSFCMMVKHHLGSAAFGSLLIAIIKTIRILAKMFERRSGRNFFAFLIWAVIQCILACIEGFLKIISKTAYVMIVLLGEPFCRSARRAFVCITKDSSVVAFLIGAETFILAVIEILITFVVTFIGIALIMNVKGVQIIWVPASIIFILSYLFCHVFFSVYSMTIDTLILCFCVDHQMNDGLEKPYYMNENLKVLFIDPNTITSSGNEGDSDIRIINLNRY